MMNRTAEDMERDYISGIADIDKRVNELKKAARKLRYNASQWAEINAQINSLECMRGDMAWALYRLREYNGQTGERP